MQMKEFFKRIIGEQVTVQVHTLTGEGEADPIPRIGTPYEIGANKKTGDTYIRMLVTYELTPTGETVALAEPKYRTIPLHKIMEDSQTRRKDLEYIAVNL
jgi:hypothetical protein